MRTSSIIEWVTAVGGIVHGLLGWGLLALIVGHLGMAILDRRMPGEDVLARMAPPAASGH